MATRDITGSSLPQGRARAWTVARWLLAWAMVLAAVSVGADGRVPDARWGDGPKVVAVATGSPGETGLLERLATEFASREGARVDWYRAGSGEALALLRRGEVDLVLAHAPAAELAAVEEGWATGRVLIGSNEFWIVGPKGDPARVRDASGARDAFRRIAKAGAPFVSRGDRSGTHQREMQLWSAAGIQPAGAWYIETRDFMAASLRRADTERAYFLTDSSTFILERRGLPNLTRLHRGDEALANPYHLLYPTRPTAGAAMARRFGEFILSARGQELMRKFGRGRYGDPLYLNAADTLRQ